MSTKESGTVKWFDNAKGFGFVLASDGEDCFVHYRDIEADGFKTLKPDETVEFVRHKTEKGWSKSQAKIPATA